MDNTNIQQFDFKKDFLEPFVDKFQFESKAKEAIMNTLERLIVVEILLKLGEKLPKEKNTEIAEKIKEAKTDEEKQKILTDFVQTSEEAKEIIKDYFEHDFVDFVKPFLEEFEKK